MSDTTVVAWKETREVFFRQGRVGKALVGGLIAVILLGFVAPLVLWLFLQRFPSLGVSFFVSTMRNVGLYGSAFLGFATAVGMIVDSIAGERERHTLEGLLASPLSTRGILFGKLLAIVGFVSLQSLLITVADQAFLLILVGQAAWAYLPVVFLGPLLAGSAALLFGCIGSLVAVRCATVRAGQQAMAYLMMPIFLLPSLLPMLSGMTPAGAALNSFFARLGFLLSALVLLAGLVVLDAALLVLSLRAFRRDRLLLRGKK